MFFGSFSMRKIFNNADMIDDHNFVPGQNFWTVTTFGTRKLQKNQLLKKFLGKKV